MNITAIEMGHKHLSTVQIAWSRWNFSRSSKGRKEKIIPYLLSIARSSSALVYIPQLCRKGNGHISTKNRKEKVVDNYIRTDILEKMPLQPCQRAYGACISTDTALYQLRQTIQNYLESGRVCVLQERGVDKAITN